MIKINCVVNLAHDVQRTLKEDINTLSKYSQ